MTDNDFMNIFGRSMQKAIADSDNGNFGNWRTHQRTRVAELLSGQHGRPKNPLEALAKVPARVLEQFSVPAEWSAEAVTRVATDMAGTRNLLVLGLMTDYHE